MSEMSGGIFGGMLQGYKSNMGLAKMDGGIRKGLLSSVGRHSKIQDPTLLTGSKTPVAFWLADYTSSTSTSTAITSVYNFFGPSFTETGSATFTERGVLNNKAYLSFVAADRVYSLENYLDKNEVTLMMVVRMSSTSADRVIFARKWSIGNTAGDIRITAESGQKIRVTFYGSGGTSTSVYETFSRSIEGTQNNQWFLLTVKCRMYQPQGQGSEMEIYANGNLEMNPVTTTFVAPNSNFPASPLNFGNDSSAASGGSNLAATLILDYWVNSSEQIRLENFFRHYYGFRF